MIILGYTDCNERKVNMRGIGERYCNIVNKIEMEIYGKTDCETA